MITLSLGLEATLLVRHPETGKIYVNFDPMISELIRETECLMKMNIESPKLARDLCFRGMQLRKLNDRLEVCGML